MRVRFIFTQPPSSSPRANIANAAKLLFKVTMYWKILSPCLHPMVYADVLGRSVGPGQEKNRHWEELCLLSINPSLEDIFLYWSSSLCFGSGHILPCIPPLVLIRVQYNDCIPSSCKSQQSRRLLSVVRNQEPEARHMVDLHLRSSLRMTRLSSSCLTAGWLNKLT